MVDIQPTVDSAGRRYLKGICPRCDRVNLLPNTPTEELAKVSMDVEVNEPEHTSIDTPIDTDMDTDIDTYTPDVSEDVSMNDEQENIHTPIDTQIDTYTEEENPQNEDTPISKVEEETEEERGGTSPIFVLVVVMIIAVVVSLFLASQK